MSNNHHLVVENFEEIDRIDAFIAKKLPQYSRSLVKKAIVEGWILVNGKKVKPNYNVKIKDDISLNIKTPAKPSLVAENIPIDIIFEDEDIIILNKPRGMVVYPAPGNYSGTLINALLNYTEELSTLGGDLRPGIVHRLDKDTSGIMIVAKNNLAHSNISLQLKKRQVRKVYRAIVWGEVKENRATINAPIGRHPVKRTQMTVTPKNSRVAVTHFKVLKRFSGFTYLEIDIETGRTHQIRVHMKYIGHPILGDTTYSRKKVPFAIQGQALHAYKLEFLHPKTSTPIEFTAPIPKDISDILDILSLREGGE